MKPSAPLPPWRLRHEIPLAVVLGAAVALAAFWWFAPFYLSGAVTTDDIFDYCAAVISTTDNQPGVWPSNRARLPVLLPAQLAPQLGTFDALLAGAVVGTGACASGLYLWASALHTRLAGFAAAGSLLALAPLVIQARMPSFYATINGSLLIAAGLVAGAARTQRPAHWLTAGCAIGIALLSDARALVWALAFVGTSVALMGLRRSVRHAALGLAALCVPLTISYHLGAWSFPETALSLEQQLDVRPLFHLHGSRHASVLPPWEYKSHFVWGRSDLTELPLTVMSLLEQARFPIPADLDMHSPPGFRDRQVLPWIYTAVATLPLGLILTTRLRRRLGLAALGTLMPYLIALWGLQHMVESQARFLTQGLPAVALGLGLLAGHITAAIPVRGGWRRHLRQFVGALVVTGLLFGVPPSPLSPAAPWRQRFAPELSQLADLDIALRRSGGEARLDVGPKACAVALRREHSAGTPKWSRWLDVRPP